MIATAFAVGKQHDMALFRASRTAISKVGACMADSGYQGLHKIADNAQTPKKPSKHHPLSDDDKKRNQQIAQQRIGCEHVIGRLKVFRILKETYRNRRKRFALRFNLLAAICNLERGD